MIHTQDVDFALYQGDVLACLAEMPDESVHCCVTSPPYWGLRDYGVEGQLGLEATPEEYVARMVAVFREVRRVLRADGTLWLNIGDSYSHGGNGSRDPIKWPKQSRNDHRVEHAKAAGDTKPKDLVGIPWRLAFALQQPYYTGRIAAERDRVWLAAILDGEGTICGMRHVRDDGNVRTGCMTFITNTSEALLDECDRIWPGSRYSEKVTSEVARPCWRWELQSAEDRSALVRELYPYLIEKKQQALVAWNLLEVVQAAKKLGRGGESDETKAKRDLLVRILGDLNGRRAVDLPSWLREPPGLHEPGWYLRSDVIWSKSNPMPESVTDRPTKAHEYVFLLSKGPRYFFDQEAVREGYKYDGRNALAVQGGDGSIQHRNGERWPGMRPQQQRAVEIAREHGLTEAHLDAIRACGGTDAGKARVTQTGYGKNTPEVQALADEAKAALGGYYREFLTPMAGRNVRSVWEIATQPYPEAHFATFPEALVERCVKAGCPQDGTVLDPFIGSGTTAYVARKLGRRSIGIELSEDYCRLAAKRLAQQSLFGESRDTHDSLGAPPSSDTIGRDTSGSSARAIASSDAA